MSRSPALLGSFVLALGSTACFNPEPPGTDDTTTTDPTLDTGSESGESGAGPTCDDLMTNGDETDLDCGGSCGPCLDGQACGGDDDCESQWCNEGTCTSPSCDDGVMDGNETDVDCGGSCPPCDDGSGCGAAQDCSSGVCTDGTCQAPTCGDGVVNDAAETCDDGGDSERCNADCTPVACGDGIVNAAAGEDCDEPMETATCDADCTQVECGDGTHNVTAGELCDDGGNSPTCDEDCTPAECGDGLANRAAGEVCDDAGESAACDVDCTPAACGDGVPNPTAGEQCDDGDMIDGNLCNNACQLNACAFDVGLLPLMVHPANHFGEIDFDGACNLIVAGGFEGTLHRITPAGVVSTLVPGFGGANSVNGVAYRDLDDLVYVATDGTPQLWSVNAAGATNLVMNLPATTNAIEVAPPGFGPFGGQIVGVLTNGQVLAIDPAAGSTSVVGTIGTEILSDLVFDPLGAVVFVAAYNADQVYAMDPSGVSMPVFGADGPDGLAIDPMGGTLFVANTSGAQSVTAVDLMTGMSNVLVNPAFDGGYYVTGLRFEAGGNLLMKVQGANIDYVTP